MEKLKKIAFVSDAIYPFNKGGKEKRLYEVTKRLSQLSYVVTVYCMKWWEGEDVMEREGVIYKAISPYYPLYSGGRRSFKEAIFFSIHCLKLIREDFDVVDVDHMPHLVLFTTKLVCLIKRKKMVATWHEVWGFEYWSEYIGGFLGFVAYLIEKITVQLPDKIISISDHTLNNLKDMLKRVDNVYLVHIGNEIDYNSLVKSKIDSDVLFVGRLLKNKNVDILIHSIKILKNNYPDIKLIIIGEGPEKNKLEKLSNDIGLEDNIKFINFLDNHDDVYSIMKSSKVFALPSSREGFGIVVVESNACGLPVVTVDSKNNASQYLIENGVNGLVCSLSEDSLANSIKDLLSNRKNPEDYVKYSQKYNWPDVISKIETVYNL